MATKFRETMWFKMGEAPEPVETDGDEGEPSATVAMLPIEDRYTGEVTAQDSKMFSLRTGTTEYVPLIANGDDDVSMDALVRELKPTKKIFAIGAGMFALCAAFAMYVVG